MVVFAVIAFCLLIWISALDPAHDNVPDVAACLEAHLDTYRELSERIHRELLMALHRRGICTIDRIQDEARARLGQSIREHPPDPNQAERDRWDDKERDLVEQVTREYVNHHFSAEDVDDIVNLTLKREQVRGLEQIANQANVSFKELAEKIQLFCDLPPGESRLAPAEVVGTRVALTRHLVSDQLEFIAVAKNHLRIRDFDHITRHLVGSDTGMGRIGGKAGGMMLAYRVLAGAEEGKDSPYLPLAVPDSYYLRSDVVEDFLRLNRLDEYQSQKYKPIEDVTREYPLIKGVFRNGDFPLQIVQSLRKVLRRMGTHPLIVRSSSLLEDRFGTAFSGKYASVFLANQGTLEQRLRALLGGIAEVYASIMAPDPILYRREHNLIDYVEEMAVLIQKVVGFRIGDYFMPSFAGVAFSRNEYRWSPRIKREDGMLRIVMGLGTRAVDRSGPDHPRMVALGAPTLRPESNVQEILRCAQRTLDVVDLKNNRLRQLPLREALAWKDEIPMLDKIVSVYQDDELYAPPGARVDADPSRIYVTFDKLLKDTPFTDRIREMLVCLEDAYGMPVDMEFATDGEKFYVLQCRTLSQASQHGPVVIPDDIPNEDVVFDARRYIRTGLIEGIEYIVYVDPLAYDAVPSRQKRIEIARAVGRINHALPERKFILVGPGRWGSNDLRLGVPVRYADINNCRMLIEVSRQKEGFVPEVSFGTHFFQDLVEKDIQYLPLYPDVEGNRFNTEFMDHSYNCIEQVVPNDVEFKNEIRVIHVPKVARGRTLTVAMDGETDRAIAYLK